VLFTVKFKEMKYNLESGFYWVKIDKNLVWTVMEWDACNNMWNVGGMPMFEPSQVKYVNSKRLIPPNEQPKITIAYEATFNKEEVDKWWEKVEGRWICAKCGNWDNKCNCI